MKTPGILREPLFYLRILTTTSVLSISLQISKTVDSISEENTWSFRKPPGKKRRVKKESDWKKYYGSCPELKEDIEQLGRQNFSRTSCHYIKHLAKQTTKKQDNSSQTTSSQNPLTQEPPSSIIVTSSADTSEKTTMMETEEIVAKINEWAMDRFLESLPTKDCLAIYQEFQEWMEPHGEDLK